MHIIIKYLQKLLADFAKISTYIFLEKTKKLGEHHAFINQKRNKKLQPSASPRRNQP